MISKQLDVVHGSSDIPPRSRIVLHAYRSCLFSFILSLLPFSPLARLAALYISSRTCLHAHRHQGANIPRGAAAYCKAACLLSSEFD